MAFGNATIGDLKKYAGSGGTKDYAQLTNKPSINGTELLQGSSIGKLSGDIKVTLSALDNVNINNPQNAQTLLLNSLTGKWENGSISGSVSITDLTTDILDSTKGINPNDYSIIIAIVKSNTDYYSIITPTSIMLNGTAIITMTYGGYCKYFINVSDNTLYLSKDTAAAESLFKVFGIN